MSSPVLPSPFWGQLLGRQSRGGTVPSPRHRREDWLIRKRPDPFPVNFLSPSVHVFSNPGSHLPAASESRRGVTALCVVTVATELPTYAFVGSWSLALAVLVCAGRLG